jgi:hypothetical protein
MIDDYESTDYGTRDYPLVAEARELLATPASSNKYDNALAEVIDSHWQGCEDFAGGNTEAPHGYWQVFTFHATLAEPTHVNTAALLIVLTTNNDGFVYATELAYSALHTEVARLEALDNEYNG